MTKTKACDILYTVDADLAHLVERDLAKVEVAGSSPVIRSTESKSNGLDFFVITHFCTSVIVKDRCLSGKLEYKGDTQCPLFVLNNLF